MKSQGEHSAKKKKEADRYVELFGLPKDLFLGMPLLSMTGNRSLCITNHRGIRQYSCEMIVVSAKACGIQVVGRGLYIPKYSEDQLEITGYLEGITFVP